jgi:hypothetical protein
MIDAVLTTFLGLVGLALLVLGLLLAYSVACFVIGRVAGALARRAHPVTEFERRRAEADERAARDATRPWGEGIDVAPLTSPNGSERA